MENQIIDDSFGLSLNDQMRSYIQEIARWANFLAIVGFIGLGFMVLGGLFASVMLTSMGSELGGLGISGGLISLIYIVVALVAFIPLRYLFVYANKAKSALRSGSDAELTEAFMNLKSYFKFVGIMTIVAIGLYAVLLLFGTLIGGRMM